MKWCLSITSSFLLVLAIALFPDNGTAFHSMHYYLPRITTNVKDNNIITPTPPVFQQSSLLFRPPTKNPRQCSVTKLQFASVALTAIDSFWKSNPYIAAGLICGIKASAADWIAQKRHARQQRIMIQEGTKKHKTDLQRNFAYIIYGSLYQGVTQEYVYNHLYPLMFGTSTKLPTVLSKVLFDMVIQTTLVTLPIAYISKAVIYRYSIKEALFKKYIQDIRQRGLLWKYFALWGPVQSLTFSIVPEHWRVSFIAFVSFFWLIILSSIASNSTTTVKNNDGLPLETELMIEPSVTGTDDKGQVSLAGAT